MINNIANYLKYNYLWDGDGIDNFTLQLWKFSDFCSRHTVGVAADDIMFHILVPNASELLHWHQENFATGILPTAITVQRDCEPTMFSNDQSSVRSELIQNGWWDPTKSRDTARVALGFWDNRNAAQWSHRRQFLCLSLVRYVDTDKGYIANVESRKCDLTKRPGLFYWHSLSEFSVWTNNYSTSSSVRCDYSAMTQFQRRFSQTISTDV